MGTDGEESDTGRRARLGRRGEMAEKRRRLARMAGQNRGARAGRAALDQFRGEQTGAMSDGERPLAAARGEEGGASSQALRAVCDVGYASGPTTRVVARGRGGRMPRAGTRAGATWTDLMCVWFGGWGHPGTRTWVAYERQPWGSFV